MPGHSDEILFEPDPALGVSADQPDMLIGEVKEGSGGISDQIPETVDCIAKDTGAVLIYERDPAVMVDRLLEVYAREHFRRPSCFFQEQEK